MRSQEDDLFELVFEGLAATNVAALSRALLGRDISLPTEEDGVSEVSAGTLPLRPGIALGDAHLRVLCYDGNIYDVELNFRLRQAAASSKDALVAALHARAIELAEAHGISTYFAGLEPASDEDTRLFTGKKKGPYYRLH